MVHRPDWSWPYISSIPEVFLPINLTLCVLFRGFCDDVCWCYYRPGSLDAVSWSGHFLNWHKFHWMHHTHPDGSLTIITGTQADRTGSSTKVSRSSEKRKVRCEKHAALGQECEQDPRRGCPCQWHRTPMWRMDNGLARLRGKYHKRCLKLPPPSSIFLDVFYVKMWACHFGAISVNIEHCQIKWPTATIHMLGSPVCIFLWF